MYTTLDAARSIVHQRWSDTSLRLGIQNYLGSSFIPEFLLGPRSVLFRCLNSPDNGYDFFHLCSQWLCCNPLSTTFVKDKFCTINEDKKGMARLCLFDAQNKRVKVDLIHWKSAAGLRLDQVQTLGNISLHQFHESLFNVSFNQHQRIDLSDFFLNHKPAANYYYYLFLHFVTHGILFESFADDSEDNPDKFNNCVVLPNFERVVSEFGLKPIIVRLYPPAQSALEDFYWWSYPKQVNHHILDWARQNDLPIKPWKSQR